jgi:peptidyl-tRNA hydrolase
MAMRLRQNEPSEKLVDALITLQKSVTADARARFIQANITGEDVENAEKIYTAELWRLIILFDYFEMRFGKRHQLDTRKGGSDEEGGNCADYVDVGYKCSSS